MSTPGDNRPHLRPVPSGSAVAEAEVLQESDVDIAEKRVPHGVFAYFNNDWEAFAPRYAQHMQDSFQAS